MTPLEEKIEEIVKTNADFFDWDMDSQQASEFRNGMLSIATQAVEAERQRILEWVKENEVDLMNIEVVSAERLVARINKSN